MRVKRFRLQHIKSFASTGWVELGPITILVGANNSGKSTLLRGLGLMQYQVPPLGAAFLSSTGERLRLEVDLEGIDDRFWPRIAKNVFVDEDRTGLLRIDYQPEIYDTSMLIGSQFLDVDRLESIEPRNYIYPYLSKRKVADFDEAVTRAATLAVPGDLRHLIAKIDRLSNPSHPDHILYTEMCEAVIGFPVTTFASDAGKRAGLITGRFSSIGIDEMGEGVSSLLGLIVDLCVADQQLFLIEELENDVHPASLKALLELIARQSASNQFLISTHSNIVTRLLGARDGTVIQKIEMRLLDGHPSSTVNRVKNSAGDRIALLSELGYELRDFDLWDGWLLLEESSAERIIRDCLIPWFAPKLVSVRTLAVGGVSKAQPTFTDFDRLFRFTHLEQVYRERAWVILDGDEVGIEAVKKLRTSYPSWPSEHFANWSEVAFENYYPLRFKAQVELALSGNREENRQAKKRLLHDVLEWTRLDEEAARAEFEVSAHEVIAALKTIEVKVVAKQRPGTLKSS